MSLVKSNLDYRGREGKRNEMVKKKNEVREIVTMICWIVALDSVMKEKFNFNESEILQHESLMVTNMVFTCLTCQVIVCVLSLK